MEMMAVGLIWLCLLIIAVVGLITIFTGNKKRERSWEETAAGIVASIEPGLPLDDIKTSGEWRAFVIYDDAAEDSGDDAMEIEVDPLSGTRALIQALQWRIINLKHELYFGEDDRWRREGTH